ncbi:MAG TPA: nucleotidyltransferase family protein [Aldersonia sp.]
MSPPAEVAGLLLAAGAGRRFGGPKALAVLDGRPMVQDAVDVLLDGGCTPVVVVTGARGDEVAALLPDTVTAVHAEAWEQGMGESLRAGLAVIADTSAQSVLVHLVDLPDVGADVVTRMLSYAGPRALARATFGGKPGHPVLFGRAWWPELATTLHGDRGARDFLAGRADLVTVECGDIATGCDVDYPPT